MFFSIDRRWIDIINIMGIVISILGFLYVSYELFQKFKGLGWILQITTPMLLGILILTPIGMADFHYSGGNVFQGAIFYGLIGAMIGVFNGAFALWPPSEKRPTKLRFIRRNPPSQDTQSSSQDNFLDDQFIWEHALASSIFAFLIWFCICLIFAVPIGYAALIAMPLSVVSGAIGGFWRFFGWEPPPIPTLSHSFTWKNAFSVRRSLFGLIGGFALAFIPGLILGVPLDALIIGAILAGIGGLFAGFWELLSWEPPLRVGTAHPLSWKDFMWRRGLIGVALAIVLAWSQYYFLHTRVPQVLITGEFLALASFVVFALRSPLRNLFPKFMKFTPVTSSSASKNVLPTTTDYSSDPSAQAEKPKPEEFKMVPPLFSAGGFLIGFTTTFVFGLLSLLLVELFFANNLQTSLSASLSAASFIGLAGAITGAISRFIFWRADSLNHDHLLGTGTLLTLFGFALQLVPQLLDFIGVQLH